MKTYNNFLKEAKAKTAVFVFGRFNPPTVGHGKLLEVANSVARRYGTVPFIFGSHSKDSKSNPLSNGQKMNYMKEMFPQWMKNYSTDQSIKTAIDVATKLNEDHDQLVMIVGSDRVPEFKKILEQYNGKKSRHGVYEYDKIEVISAGERDPDSDDVSGMSATKMRKAASEYDYTTFKRGVPTTMSESSMKRMLKDVRKGLNLKEAIFQKVWPKRPERLTIDKPEKDNEYNYLNYETENFSHMPLVEETFIELRSMTLSHTKHNVAIVEAMKETDKLIRNVLIFENGNKEYVNEIQYSIKKIDKLFEGIEKDYGCTKGDLFYRPYLYKILEVLEWGTRESVRKYAEDTPGQDPEELLKDQREPAVVRPAKEKAREAVKNIRTKAKELVKQARIVYHKERLGKVK